MPSRCPTRARVEQRSNGLFLEENSKVLSRCSAAHTKWGSGANGFARRSIPDQALRGLNGLGGTGLEFGLIQDSI
jgi:hypothetical protein